MIFSGKVVCITGAARGIGFALAKAFVSQGAEVILTDIDERSGIESATTLDATFEKLDVREHSSAQRAISRIVRKFGRIDVWINNAGIANHKLAIDLSPEEWKESIDVMLSGAFFCANQIGPVMIEQESGCLINIGSVNGLLAQKGRAPYCSAKAGLIMLTKVLASEWGQYGVRVNAVAPGIVKTDLAIDAINSGIVNEQDYLGRVPMGRWGELSEVVDSVLFLANEEESSFVNGEVLRVDGGWAAYHLFHPFEDAFNA